MPVYQILHGEHTGPDIKGTVRDIRANTPNNTIETHQDLLAMNGPPPMSPKFRLAEEVGAH